MSHYETPEQRQIRELRNRITAMTDQTNYQTAQNRTLQRELDIVRKQQQTENARLLQQIQRQQGAAEKVRTQMSATIRELDAQVRERERLQQERIQAMQHQHEEQVRRLENEFQAERQDFHNEIRQTRSEMQQRLSQLRTETDQKLQKQREENQRNIDQLSVKLEGRINDVNRKVNSIAHQIAARDQGERELAEYWAQEAARMLNQIQESFKSQLLNERKIAAFQRKIRQANEDIRSGQYQSSITAGRDTFFDALDMKEDLAAAELEWNYWFNALKTREIALIQALSSAEHRVYEVDTDDGTIEYSNGIDYWTDGKFTSIHNKATELLRTLESVDNMTLEELQAAEEKVRDLQEQLISVENIAHSNVAMSVSRYDTATKIGKILDSNFEMTESDGEFFGREDREEYHAVFQNPVTGDQAAVVITPIRDKDGLITNHVELLVGNADNNPVTRDVMVHEVAKKLEPSVENCSFPCANRFGDGIVQEVTRVSNIAAVEAGDEGVRAKLPASTTAPSKTVSSKVRRRVSE